MDATRSRSRQLLTAIVATGALMATWSGPSAAGAATRRADPPTAYVTNNQLNTVTVITGRTVVATIAHVGEGPAGIALTPDHQTAYVADFGFLDEPSHTVTPIDLTTRTVGAPILVGPGPFAIAITPDGTRAVVTLQGTSAHPGDQVVVVDLASRTVSPRLTVGMNPESLAIAPDGATAYIANFSSASVTPIDLTVSPPEAEAPIPLPGTSPRAIAIGPDGHTAYVLDAANATIIPIHLPTRTVGAPVDLVCTKGGDPGCTPAALTITPGGRSAYVAAAGSGDVIQLSLPTLSVTRVIPTGGYPDALGLSGKWLFVGNAASNTVSVFHGSRTRVDVPGVTYPFGIGVVPGS